MRGASAVGVSVVIPCYRAAGTVARAVGSVLSQTRPPGQILLVDDGSGDGTLAALQALAAGAPDRIEVLALNQNQGAASTRNAGWERAREDYVAFLDADDVWPPWKLELQHGFMSSDPAAALTGGRVFLAPTDWAATAKPSAWQPRRLSLGAMLVRNLLSTSTVMLRRDVKLRFAAGKRHAEDYLLWLELLAQKNEAYLFPVPLAYRFDAGFGGGGLSGDLWTMWRGERDVYRRLARAGHLRAPVLAATQLGSGLRFLRRLVLTWARSRN